MSSSSTPSSVSTSSPALGFGFPAPLLRTQSSGNSNVRLTYPRLAYCEVLYIQAPKPPSSLFSPPSSINSNAASLLQSFSSLSSTKYEEDTLKKVHSKQKELSESRQNLQELIHERHQRIEKDAEEKLRKQREEEETKRQKEREEELKRKIKEEADRKAAELKKAEEENKIQQFMELSGIIDSKTVREYLSRLDWDINRATSIFFSDGSMESAMEKAAAIEASRRIPISSSSSSHRLSSAAPPAMNHRVPSPAAIRLSIQLPDATQTSGEFKESQSLWDIYFHVQESTYLRNTTAPFHFIRNTPYQVFGEDKFGQTLKEANITNGASIRVQMGTART